MTIFAVFRVSDSPKMEAAIQAAFPEDYYKLQDDEWLVSAIGTAREIAIKLKVSGESADTGSALIFSMANYYGRAPTEIWDWINAKAEKAGG